jgi:predicted MFS family arabinose efflux permease
MAVYAMIFLNGAIATFYLPARSALLPNLLNSGQLIKANTLVTATIAVANVGGSGIGGFVAEKIGVEWAVMANALAYVVSMALVWTIRMEPHATTSGEHAHPEGGWGELKTGLMYLWEHKTAMPLVILTAVFAFVGAVFLVAFTRFAVEIPPYGLGLGTGGLGYLLVAGGAGAGLGMIAVGRAKQWTRAIWLPFVQLTMLGVLLVILSKMTNPWLAAVVLIALGAVAAPLMIPIDSKLQEQVDENRRGAVFATRGMLTSATMCLALGLQIWSSVLRDAPSTTILLQLGYGTLAAALLLLLVMRVWDR